MSKRKKSKKWRNYLPAVVGGNSHKRHTKQPKAIVPKLIAPIGSLRTTEKFALKLNDEVFMSVMLSLLRAAPNETSGAGWVDEIDDSLVLSRVFANSLDRRAPSSVTSSMAEADMYAICNEIPVANCQWHTHPGLSCFWSQTDLRQQRESINERVDSMTFGTFYFLVFDEFECLVRRYDIDQDSILYTDGHGVLSNHENFSLESPERSWTRYTPISSPKNKTWASKAPRGLDDDDDSYYKDSSGSPVAMTTKRREGLFGMFWVKPGEWLELKSVIDIVFPGKYISILSADEDELQAIEDYLATEAGIDELASAYELLNPINEEEKRFAAYVDDYGGEL